MSSNNNNGSEGWSNLNILANAVLFKQSKCPIFNSWNPTFSHLKALPPRFPAKNFQKKSFPLFFCFGIMNRLQLSSQLQNRCNNIEIVFAGANMILIVHVMFTYNSSKKFNEFLLYTKTQLSLCKSESVMQ